MCVRRSIDNFVQTYRDMSPARVAMANRIKRPFTQMVSFILIPENHSSLKIGQIVQCNCPTLTDLRLELSLHLLLC